jgi:HK97 gp10 family phage protein
MAKLSVRVDGLTKARETVAALPEAFKDQARESFQVFRRIVLTEADRRVPVRLGTLKRSLGSNTREDGLQVAVGSGDFKAKFVEFATNDTPAQPFLYPAFRAGAKFVRRDMRNWAEKAGEQAKFMTKRSGSVKRAQSR